MKLSIIIPTLNEAQYIGRLLDRLITAENTSCEILVIDGGSDDETIQICEQFDVNVIPSKPSRAVQMNLGAKKASGEVLYFVHADTLPPDSFFTDILKGVELDYEAGCYRSKYETDKWLLWINQFFTRFKILIGRGGDQSLFIRKELFFELGMFDESMELMEEYPLIKKLLKRKKFKIFDKGIQISTRKYENTSWLQVNRANAKAWQMFRRGEDTSRIKSVYLKMLKKEE